MLVAYLPVVRLVQLFVAVDAAFVPEPWPERKTRIRALTNVTAKQNVQGYL